MGKQSKKNNKKSGLNSKSTDKKPTKTHDKDIIIFTSMAQEHKNEGNKLFQTKDYEGAMLKYEKALKLLPANHADVSYLRSNIAACYMQMGISDFPRAVHECNLALEVTPKYSKALLKRARCYEALDRLDLALRDANTVLDIEPRNLMATEIVDRVKSRINEGQIHQTMEIVRTKEEQRKKDAKLVSDVKSCIDEGQIRQTMEIVERVKSWADEGQNRQTMEIIRTKEEETEGVVKLVCGEDIRRAEILFDCGIAKGQNGQTMDIIRTKEEEAKRDFKLVYEEDIRRAKNPFDCGINVGQNGQTMEIMKTKEEEAKRDVKFVYGEDIRRAKIPFDCDILKLRGIINECFPFSRGVLVKYLDEEGDMVTITTNEELRRAESSFSGQQTAVRLYVTEVKPEHDPFFDHFRHEERKRKLDDWILEFAQLFKNYIGFDSDLCLDLHELGMKAYSEAMEETVTSEEAQGLFQKAGNKFQEMTVLALLNWGNVHMSQARKRVCTNRDEHFKDSFERAKTEYTKAGEKYEEAIRLKPDFYEGFLALGKQRFEKAKLCWCFATKNANLDTWDSREAIQLYNEAEESVEKGMQMWGLRDDDEQGANMRCQMNILWGTMLYERSIMEYKLGIPVWQECLEISVEKFEAAGASPTDVAVMIKNHCSNHASPEGVGFNIDEIVQAWNEMYEAKMWQTGIPSFRLEPLLQRRVSKLFHALEHA